METNVILNELETKVISSKSFKSAIDLKKISALSAKLTDAKKAKFERSLELSGICLSGINWFKDPATKQYLKDLGLKWTAEEFILKVFGMQKSFFYKLVKAAELQKSNPDLVADFSENSPELSIEELLKTAADAKKAAERAASGEESGEESGADQAAKEELIPITIKIAQHTLKTKINQAGECITGNCKDDILDAIQLLQDMLSGTWRPVVEESEIIEDPADDQILIEESASPEIVEDPEQIEAPEIVEDPEQIEAPEIVEEPVIPAKKVRNK